MKTQNVVIRCTAWVIGIALTALPMTVFGKSTEKTAPAQEGTQLTAEEKQDLVASLEYCK